MLCDHCVLLCVVCFIGLLIIWCIVNVLCYVDLRLYILRFAVCWRFGAAGFEWCPCCRLQPHQISNTQRTENKAKDVVVQQHIRKLLMMDILLSETC